MAEEQAERGPTPETRARLKPDPIQTLRRRIDPATGQPFLSAEHERARDEIEFGYSTVALLGGTGYVLTKHERTSPSSGIAISERRARAFERYGDWVDELWRRKMRLVHGVVLDAITEDMGLREIEERRRLRNGSAAEMVRQGLQLMAEMMGLLGPRDLRRVA